MLVTRHASLLQLPTLFFEYLNDAMDTRSTTRQKVQINTEECKGHYALQVTLRLRNAA
jgi:hypothetical protein